MAKILFLHGFSSCGKGVKSTTLKGYFGKEEVLAPNLAYAPLDAIAQLEEMLQHESIDLLVGSSLGGFYATYLA